MRFFGFKKNGAPASIYGDISRSGPAEGPFILIWHGAMSS
jgi:hypothetical protein